MRAADAGIIAIVEGIVRHFMDSNVGPDILGAPLRQRIEFHQRKFVIPFDQTGVRPVRPLIASDARDPGRIATEDLCQWLHLAHIATLIGVTQPKGVSILRGLPVWGQQGLDLDDLRGQQSILLNNPIPYLIGFGEEKVSIQIKEWSPWIDLMNHIDQGDILCSEAARQNETQRIVSEGMGQDLPWLMRFK